MKITIEGTAKEIASLVLGLQEPRLTEDSSAVADKAISCLRESLNEWTGNLVGLMHNNRISNSRLAQELNVTDRYVSMVLNGHRDPPGAEERFTAAVRKIIEEDRAAS